jgi:hypothetical protein
MADLPAAGGAPPEACAHLALSAEGRCRECGECVHELVLNGACYACGQTDLVLTNKPTARAEIVPAARLTERRR